MEYYQLSQEMTIQNQIKPIIKKETFPSEKDKPVFIPGIVSRERDYIYFLPIIEKPILMVTDEVKTIWEIYQRDFLYFPCVVGHVLQGKVKIYWRVIPKVVDCIDKQTTYHKDGTIDQLYLSEEQIGYQKVFQVKHKQQLIVELEVLEQMWKKKIHGFHFQRVKMKRKEE